MFHEQVVSSNKTCIVHVCLGLGKLKLKTLSFTVLPLSKRAFHYLRVRNRPPKRVMTKPSSAVYACRSEWGNVLKSIKRVTTQDVVLFLLLWILVIKDLLKEQMHFPLI